MRKVLITEDAEREIIDSLLTESFYPMATQVLTIKQYLDKNFARQELDDIDNNGFPSKDKTVIMLSKDGQALKTIQMSELLLILDDKYSKMITDKEDRRKFLKQVIRDWYSDSISKDGILTVNYI